MIGRSAANGTGRLLLTVSGVIPEGLERDVEIGRRPRPDYAVLAAAFEADLVDYATARRSCGLIGRLIERLAGPAVLLAWHCYRHRHHHPIVFTDSEGVGLPYAALTWFSRRRPRHVMIGHRLSARKKVIIQHLLQLRRRIDDVIVYSTAQRDVAVDRLRYRRRQVHLTPFMVDTEFWQPRGIVAATVDRTKICAVGQELRDYPTLVSAVRTLDVDVVVAAASPWSKRDDTSAGVTIPDNVRVEALDHFALRQLYSECEVVVVPLQPTDFQAGITTILEAMSMSRPLVCTITEGQTDTIVEGLTGLYVPPGDALALRNAIEQLLGDSELRDRITAAARRWAVTEVDVEVYARRLVSIIEAADLTDSVPPPGQTPSDPPERRLFRR